MDAPSNANMKLYEKITLWDCIKETFTIHEFTSGYIRLWGKTDFLRIRGIAHELQYRYRKYWLQDARIHQYSVYIISERGGYSEAL